MKKLIFVALFLGSGAALAVEDSSQTSAQPNAGVKYKAGKDLNFDELLIEGALKRPELSVVTGDGDNDANGLLRLRENFVDRMTVDASEDIQ